MSGWVTHVHTVTVVRTAIVPCSPASLVCFLDKHPALGPVLTLAGALLIAWTGWARERRRLRSERKAFSAVAVLTVWRTMADFAGLISLAEDDNYWKGTVSAASIAKRLPLADLDRLLESPLDRWPSTGLYEKTLRVRAELRRLLSIAGTQDPASFNMRKMAKDIKDAEDRFDRATARLTGRSWKVIFARTKVRMRNRLKYRTRRSS